MSKRYTKFSSNYLMRSRHQETELGRVLERDWVTTTGLNVLRFGSGRRIWYNSGNFVFTTSNIPAYHKKHRLTTETQEWTWEDVADADGTVNTVTPLFYTSDLRNYAYYGSCAELVRATIEEIIGDFPGRLVSTSERIFLDPHDIVRTVSSEPSFSPSLNDVAKQVLSEVPYYYNGNSWEELTVVANDTAALNMAASGTFTAGTICYVSSDDTAKKVYIRLDSGDVGFNVKTLQVALDSNNCWVYRYIVKDDFTEEREEGDDVFYKEDDILTQEEYDQISEYGREFITEEDDTVFGTIMVANLELYQKTNGLTVSGYADLDTQEALGITNEMINGYGGKYALGVFGNETYDFSYIYNYDWQYYAYNFSTKTFEIIEPEDYDITDGYVLSNPFNIDMHHKRVTLGTYDNEMRFMSHSWSKYKVIEGDSYNSAITNYTITDNFFDSTCPANNEERVIKIITIDINSTEEEEEDSSGNPPDSPKHIPEYTIYAYYVSGEIRYLYRPISDESIIIQPQQEYIDEYFASLAGFKSQLLRQDTKPYYSNDFITPTEYNFVWYYPERRYTWPSDDYCIDIGTIAFSSFVNKLYTMAQNFDNLWSDNLYRSMTHEAIKNFDWTYTREYYEGDEQDNIDGGERMQKIVRIMGRVFDDIKFYIDNIKKIRNVTYDKRENMPEALLSDGNEIKGTDIISTISKNYDIDTYISADSLTGSNIVSEKDNGWITGASTLPRWYPTRNPEDIYPDVCDNEMMRRIFLSIKHIMRAKGTQHGIEMMLALFGLGRDVDYEIEEEAYFTKKMIHYDECVDGTLEGETTGDDWSSTNGVSWNDVSSTTKGNLAAEINAAKSQDLLYYTDLLSGTAMRTVYLGRSNTPYLVPYYDQAQLYDGDLLFQGKGGWGKFTLRGDSDPYDDYFDYQETLSYLHVVGTVSNMLSLNPRTLSVNTVYFVANLGDYTDYDENPPMIIDGGMTMSHYFILVDEANSNRLSGWRNIVVQPELDADGNLQMVTNTDTFEGFFGDQDNQTWAYDPSALNGYSDGSVTYTDDEVLSTYKYAFKKMVYLDNIVSKNLANNPHVGYGNYDDGSTFIEYMKLPFKYLLDNYSISNYSLSKLAELYKFDDIDTQSVNDKIQIMNTRKSAYKVGDTITPQNYKLLTEEEQAYVERFYVIKSTFGVYAEGMIMEETEYDSLSDSAKSNIEFTYAIVKTAFEPTVQVTDFVRYKKMYQEGDSLTLYEYDRLTDEERQYVTKLADNLYVANADFEARTGQAINYDYSLGDDDYNTENIWYINTKTLTITSNIEDNTTKGLFTDYFKSIIMPYLMQVVPSTTILKLKNFG